MSKHAAPQTATQIVHDRLHDVRVQLGEVVEHVARHAKPAEIEGHVVPMLWAARAESA